MLRIGICDDSADARDTLRIRLEKVLHEGEEIVYEFSTGAGMVRWLEKHPGEIDLLFLDVEMEGTNGMKAAQEIRHFDTKLTIVFVTGYSDYVFDGYRVNALDYIIKPAKPERLCEVMNRVRSLLEDKKYEMFVFKNMDGIYRLPIDQILYFYSDKRVVVLVCNKNPGQKEYSFYAKLDEVEQQLKGKFVRIHQRYLVNPQLVQHIGTDHVTICEKKFPISRALKEKALSRLAKAMMM